VENDFFFRRDSVGLHRLYTTDSEGYCLVNGQKPGFLSEKNEFSMDINDLVEVSLCEDIKTVVIRNVSQNKTLKLPLSNDAEAEDLFACVGLGWKGDSVEIMNTKNSTLIPVKFDVANPVRPDFRIQDNVVTLINDIDAQFAFSSKSLGNSPSCHFKIWHKKSSKLAIGLSSKSTVQSGYFALDFQKPCSNCLLFHADGTTTNSLLEKSASKSAPNFHFDEGDQVILSYDSHFRVLQAHLQSKGTKTVFEMSVELKSLEDYHFCVLLLATGDEVRL